MRTAGRLAGWQAGNKHLLSVDGRVRLKYRPHILLTLSRKLDASETIIAIIIIISTIASSFPRLTIVRAFSFSISISSCNDAIASFEHTNKYASTGHSLQCISKQSTVRAVRLLKFCVSVSECTCAFASALTKRQLAKWFELAVLPFDARFHVIYASFYLKFNSNLPCL